MDTSHPMPPIAFPCLTDNGHLRAILSRFGSVAIAPGDIPPHAAMVFLCFTNRSGSNFLADALHSSGRLNLAGELLNAEAVLEDTRLHAHPRFADYLAAQMRWRMAGQRFVVKLALGHLEILGRSGLLDQCRETARFVFVERSDRLGQAISYEIARQTGQWTSQTRIERAIGDVVYARQRLTSAMDAFADENREFDRFFGHNGIVPAHVVYEHLVADPPATVRMVGEAIGLPGLTLVPSRMSLQRQAGPLNARWRERYLAGR